MSRPCIKIDDTIYNIIEVLSKRFNIKSEEIYKIINAPFEFSKKIMAEAVDNDAMSKYNEIYIDGLVRFKLNKADYGKFKDNQRKNRLLAGEQSTSKEEYKPKENNGSYSTLRNLSSR